MKTELMIIHSTCVTVDNTTCRGCYLWSMQGVFRCRSTSLESSSSISSSHELCCNFPASSQNYIIYGGVRCDW